MAQLLLIDDDRFVSKLLVHMLEAGGHQVRVEHDPWRGLAAARIRPPAVLLLDVQMPDLDGIALLERLHQYGQQPPPTILITAYSATGSAATLLAQAQPLGAVAVLAKPVKQVELLAAVESALGGTA